MLDSLKSVLLSPGCFGDLMPKHDTRFNSDVKSHLENVARNGSVGKHFQNAFGYVIRGMENVNECR